MVEIQFQEIDLSDLDIDIYSYFSSKIEDYPSIIYIELVDPEPYVVVKAHTATSIVLTISLEILESFKEVDYSSNDPEEWVREELKRIEEIIKKYEDKLHDEKLFRAKVTYVTDGDSAAYIIAFYL